MKYNIKYIVYFFILLIFPFVVKADPKEYVIDGYNVDIDIKENKIYEVTEEISVNFLMDGVDFYKRIPILNKVNKKNGNSYSLNTSVDDIKVINDTYKIYHDDQYINIKLDNNGIGSHLYKIKYSYNVEDDKFSEYDDFYFNIIGNYMDTTIENINFSIKFPKKIEEDKLFFNVEDKGFVLYDYLTYTIDNNIVKGSYNSKLRPNNGIDVTCELYEGYFNKDVSFNSKLIVLMFLIPFSGLNVCFWLWFRYGKDDKLKKSISSKLQTDINIYDYAYYVNEKVDINDVNAMVIYFANKGYINVIETSAGYSLEKVKDYDGEDEIEKQLFDVLFDYEVEYDYVLKHQKIKELEKKYLDIFNIIKLKVEKKESKNKIIESNSSSKNLFLYFMILISMIAMLYIPTFKSYAPFTNLIVASIFSVIIFMMLYIALNSEYFVRVICNIIAETLILIIVIIPWLKNNVLIKNPLYFAGFTFGMTCIVLMFIIIKFMPKRTKFGIDILNEANGFERFIENAKDKDMIKLFSDNEEYFYELLPYSYVLDCNNIYLLKSKVVKLSCPKWFKPKTRFSYDKFCSIMNDIIYHKDKRFF